MNARRFSFALFSAALLMAVVAPTVAYLQQMLPVPVLIVPVAAANAVYILAFAVLYRKSPYLAVGASVAVGLFPAWCLLCLLALPLTAGALKTCSGGFRENDAARIGKLEGLSAGTHFLFGLLLALGLLLAKFY